MSLRRQNYPRRSGFTIIELIVAFTIMLLMLFLIDQLFMNTSRAITQGVSLTNLVHNSNVVNEQLARDSEEMLAPRSPTGGFLIILNDKIQAPRLKETTTYNEDYYAETGSATPPDIRSDQLVFIYDNLSNKILEPMCPLNSTNFFNSTGASYIRMWYGHLRRTHEDGTDTGMGDLGQSGVNRVALDWCLGRQALFLTEAVDATNSNPPIRCDSTSGSTAAKNMDGYYDTTITGYGNTTADGFPAAVNADSGGLKLYKGVADVAAWDLGPDTNVNPKKSLLWHLRYGTGDYITNALKLTYGFERLRVNPYPKYDASLANFQYTWASWQVAQMHAFFVEHISDFEVNFAGDYDGVAGIDTDVSGNIKWYDNYNPPPVASYQTSITGAAPNEYYRLTNAELPAGFLGDRAARSAFVWRHDDVTAASKWPYLLRIRYRLHDPRGAFTSYDPVNQFTISGMWFESILSVKRP